MRMATTSVPTLLRQQIDQWADTWLKTKFSRVFELRAQDPGAFNYPIAVFSEWRGKAFYLNVRYRARSRRPEDDFVVRQTRMTLTGFGRFDLGVLPAHRQMVHGLPWTESCGVLSGDRGQRGLLADGSDAARADAEMKTTWMTHSVQSGRRVDLDPLSLRRQLELVARLHAFSCK